MSQEMSTLSGFVWLSNSYRSRLRKKSQLFWYLLITEDHELRKMWMTMRIQAAISHILNAKLALR